MNELNTLEFIVKYRDELGSKSSSGLSFDYNLKV